MKLLRIKMEYQHLGYSGVQILGRKAVLVLVGSART